MIGELSIINEWIPEQMEPGTVFVLENAGEVGEKEDPYWAVLSCPSCGTLGLITRKQMAGLLPTFCGSSVCSAQFFIVSLSNMICFKSPLARCTSVTSNRPSCENMGLATKLTTAS